MERYVLNILRSGTEKLLVLTAQEAKTTTADRYVFIYCNNTVIHILQYNMATSFGLFLSHHQTYQLLEHSLKTLLQVR